MMTKKDFEMVASVIRSLRIDAGTRRMIAEVFGERLAKAYPPFLYLKFYNQCFPKKEAPEEISKKLLKIHDGNVIS